MNNTETFRVALKALSSNKVRTFLTMLGVIIGVFAVVTLVSLVKGVQNYVDEQFETLGSNLVFISPGRAAINADPALSYTNNKLEEKHVDYIASDIKGQAIGVSPYIVAGKSVKYKSKNYYGMLAGGNEDFFKIFQVNMQNGKEFDLNDVRSSAKVVILGADAKKKLFGSKNPIGESVRIENESFDVIGVAKEKGADWDTLVYMPHTTMKDHLGAKELANIIVKFKPNVDITLAQKELELDMLKFLKKDDFTVMTQKQILNEVQGILSVLSIGLGAIAAISLLVGGIGIMNIMLVSVTERTREVGLRKALGATSFNIGFQFIIESILISASGGIIGLLLGIITTFLVQSLIKAEIPWWTVFVALGFSSIVGVVFGTYPAYKASKKDPIEALRYE